MSAGTRIPKRLVQFWHNRSDLPEDVKACMDSWRPLEQRGFSFLVFDDESARSFVTANYETRHLQALDACYHPAMRADFFRLCYIGLLGGCYVDADDKYRGEDLAALFEGTSLALQPLCYDMASGAMVPAREFTTPGAGSTTWIFYFNNNPLIAPPRHPVVVRALERATALLNATSSGDLPDIQSTTGPGNLTASLVAEAMRRNGSESPLAIRILPNWEGIATSVWPLSYRSDARNWRLSNRQPLAR